MEVVVGVSVLTHASSFLLNRYFNNRNFLPAAESPPSENDDEQLSELRKKVQALEEKLAQMRAEARAVNSPDTFVSYARITRAANGVEQELNALRGMLAFCLVM